MLALAGSPARDPGDREMEPTETQSMLQKGIKIHSTGLERRAGWRSLDGWPEKQALCDNGEKGWSQTLLGARSDGVSSNGQQSEQGKF